MVSVKNYTVLVLKFKMLNDIMSTIFNKLFEHLIVKVIKLKYS